MRIFSINFKEKKEKARCLMSESRQSKGHSSDRWLIVGLGNPGKQYEQTRHNVGFMVVERLARAADIRGKGEAKFNAIVGMGRLEGYPVVLAQPTTFMNLSGEAVSRIMHFYQIPPERCLVVYDEAALPFGKLRVRPDGSAAGHNGIKSLIQHMGGTNTFPRIRIGIGHPADQVRATGETRPQKPMHHHVLSTFDAHEQPYLDTVLDTAIQAIEATLTEGVAAAMTRFNGLQLVPDLVSDNESST